MGQSITRYLRISKRQLCLYTTPPTIRQEKYDEYIGLIVEAFNGVNHHDLFPLVGGKQAAV